MINRVSCKLIGLLYLGTAAIAPDTALAQPSSSRFSGTIGTVFVSGGENYGFRTTLNSNGTNVLAGCPFNFAYVNADSDNYQADVAVLMTLYARSTPVNIVMTPDGNGFCKLVEFGS